MHGWLIAQMTKCMDDWIHKWRNAWMAEYMCSEYVCSEYTDDWMHVLWMHRWLNVWVTEYICPEYTDDWMHVFWMYRWLKAYVQNSRPDQGSNWRPPDHDSTFHVTETPSLIPCLKCVLPLCHKEHYHTSYGLSLMYKQYIRGLVMVIVLVIVFISSP